MKKLTSSKSKDKTLVSSASRVFFLCLMLFSILLSIPLNAQGQQNSISGQISDVTNKEPLVGVSVIVKGTTTGILTDIDGKFSIAAPIGSTLVITYIGFEKQEIPITNRTPLNIQLKEDSQLLEDVVVVGYGVQKKSDVTGSVTSVSKDRLAKIPVTNVLQAVQGAAAGVIITQQSSVPGDAPSALVRGQNSINANSGPYIVVDGIPMTKSGGTLNDINPADIASMEILKDASAVAIYGTNGANGVILITTKRGTTGKPVIRYNGHVGVESMAHILEPRNGEEYLQKFADWMKQMGREQTSPVPNYGELANYEAGITTDWIDLVSQTGIIQDHNVSISGGTSDMKYFLSGGYMDQKGVLQGYNYKRVSLRSNLDADVTKYLTIGTSLFLTNHNRDGGRVNLLNASAMSPFGQIYNADGSYKIYPMEPEQLFANPLLGLTTDRERRSFNVNMNGYAEVKFSGFLQGLRYKLNVGYTYLPTRTSSYTGREANNMLGNGSIRNTETNSYTIENIVMYTRDWNKHHFDFTGLYSAQQRKFNESTAGATGFVNDLLSFNNLGAGATQTSASYADKYSANSHMGRINYSYDSKYLFTLTARRDGSSVFGRNTSKYGTFPSVALGWNINNEDFMKSVDAIDNLKLRLSYGKSGNEAIPVYRTISTSSNNKIPSNGIGETGMLLSNLGNSDLEWEKTTSANIGIDFAFLRSRISGTIDMYSSKTTDLLLLRSIPLVTGYSQVYDNLGETANKGIELTLTTRNIETKNFGWESTLVFAANKNKIVDLYGDKKDDLGNRWFIGHPINVVYDYKMQGIWQEDEISAGLHKTQDPTAKAGDLKFEDVNGDGQITAEDRVILGQTSPKWTAGLTNTFRYKNWNLSIFLQTAQGMTKNNPDLNYVDETGKRNTPREVGYWTSENRNNTRPALSYYNTRGYGYASDADYIRIKDITLSYVFDPGKLDKIGIGGLTVYASGRNLHTFTNWIGWDPESRQITRGSQSWDSNLNEYRSWEDNYPVVRTVVFGLNITLK